MITTRAPDGANKRSFQNSKLHINSHVFWICIQASMTLRAGSSVLSQNWAPIPFTPTPPHQPPTEGIDYCTCPSISLYLQPTMPLLPMYLLPMPIVPVTDCTNYLLPVPTVPVTICYQLLHHWYCTSPPAPISLSPPEVPQVTELQCN